MPNALEPVVLAPSGDAEGCHPSLTIEALLAGAEALEAVAAVDGGGAAGEDSRATARRFAVGMAREARRLALLGLASVEAGGVVPPFPPDGLAG